MSDESSDEYFASADEGSMTEEDEIGQSHATQCALKTPLPRNKACGEKLEATSKAPTVLDEHSKSGFSLPVDEASCHLATSSVAPSVKQQSTPPQKLIEPISVEPKHNEQKSYVASAPVPGLISRDNVTETLQPTATSIKLHTSEGPMVKDPITCGKDDKLTPRELNLDDSKKNKRAEPIKQSSEHVKTLDVSPILCVPESLHVTPESVVTTDGSSPTRCCCQQESTQSHFDSPSKTTSTSLNEHSHRSEWHGTGGLNQQEPSLATTGDERTHITSANLLESEEVNAWDDDSWGEAEKIEDVRESSEEPGPHLSVVTDSTFSSTSDVPTHPGKIKPSVDRAHRESPTRRSVTHIPEADLIGTLDQESSSTGELKAAVPSSPSIRKASASKAQPVPLAVDTKEQNRMTHPAGDPAPEQIALDALNLNSKCEAECVEQSAQPRKIAVADKHDLETESESTINIVHKTSSASQASVEAEGWDLTCVSALPSLPQTFNSSSGRKGETESNHSVAFKQMPNDWDADWINEEEEEVFKAPPNLATPSQKKDTLPEQCEDGTRPEETNDDWDFEEWDCADKTPVVAAEEVTPKSPTQSEIAQKTADSSGDVPILPDYLSTAATSLVKTVGGGLASFVDSFSLSNLSSTLAAFDGAPPSAQQPPCTDSPRNDVNPQNEAEPKKPVLRSPAETETKVAVDDGGWGLGGMSWTSFAKSFSSTVENTGMQLLQGGVDVLETIGKKTFTALKETDPGLSYTKKFLRAPQISQTTRLSQVLREASRQHQENLSQGPTRVTGESAQDRRGDFAYQLEISHALVHMEALDLVSSRASAHLHAKITSLQNLEFPRSTTKGEEMSISSLTSDGGVLEKIWQTLQADESQSEEEHDAVENIMVNLNLLDSVCPATAVQQKYKQLREKSKESASISSATDVFCTAIDSLAEATTAMLTYLHKLAECLLSRPEKVQDGFLDLAQKVTLIIQTGKKYNESLCSEYVELLKQTENEGLHHHRTVDPPPISSKRHMANLFLETGAANDYLSSASGSFVPIIQLLCINSFFPDAPS